MKKCILLVLLLITSLAQAGDMIKLLTIGNSFAGNSTRYLQQIAQAAGHKIVLGEANPRRLLAGAPLEIRCCA